MKNNPRSFISAAILIFLLPLSLNADFADERKLFAADGLNDDNFGWSVSISDDTAIVGERLGGVAGAGAARIYVRDPVTGNWAQQQKLEAVDGLVNDEFGVSVSIDGDTAIVGVKGDDDQGSSSGSALVFVRDPVTDVWALQQKLLASDGAAFHIFGKSVAISGDTAIVGADFSTLITLGTGKAYIFVRDPATGIWTEQAILQPSDGATNDFFGYSVGIDGDTALVGAAGSNASYAFERDPATGIWTEAKLLRGNGLPGVGGRAVSIRGNLAITGAFNLTSNGAAIVFERDPATGAWTEQQLLLEPSPGSHRFGESVAMGVDVAIVGAHTNNQTAMNAGAAYAFVRDPVTDSWNAQQLLASDGGGFHQFGFSVAIDGNSAIIGADQATGAEAFTGAAYVYTNPLLTDQVCDIRLNQASFTGADTVTAEVFRFANLAGADTATEIKIWLGVPGIPPISVTNAGSDGSVVFAAGTDVDFGPLQLFPVTGLPLGNYELSCRMLDPVTGELLTEDLNFFEIQ